MIAFPKGRRKNKLDQWSLWAELPVVSISEGSTQANMTPPKEKEELICLDVRMYYFYCTSAVDPCCRRSELWQMLVKQALSEDKLLQNKGDKQDWKCCFPPGSICESVRVLLAAAAALAEGLARRALQVFKGIVRPQNAVVILASTGVPRYLADAMSYKCNPNPCFLMECMLLIT